MSFLRRRLSYGKNLTMVEFSVTFGTIYNGDQSSFALGCPDNSWGYGSAYGGTINASPANYRGAALPQFGTSQTFISNGIDACDLGEIYTRWNGTSNQTFVKLEWWNTALSTRYGTLYSKDADIGSSPAYQWTGIGFFASASGAYKIRLFY